MARYLRDCTTFILNSGDTEEEQMKAFGELQVSSPRKFTDLSDFLFLSTRARVLVKNKVLARYLRDSQPNLSQDRIIEVLLCGSDDDCRFLLKGAKESSRNALRSFLLDGLIVSSQFVTAKKYPDLNRCALVLMNTNAADYVQAEALLAKYYAKEERAFNRVFNEKVQRSVPVSITSELQRVYQNTAGSNGVVANNYGYCPECLAPANFRERSRDGDTICINGHKTKTSLWETDPTKLVPSAQGNLEQAAEPAPVPATKPQAPTKDLTLRVLVEYGWVADGDASVSTTQYGEKVELRKVASGYSASFTFGDDTQRISFTPTDTVSEIRELIAAAMRAAYISSVRRMLLASGWNAANNPQDRKSIVAFQRKQFYELSVVLEKNQLLLRANKYIKHRYELSIDSVTDKKLVDTILEDAKEPMALMLRELSFDADVYVVFETEENPPKYLVTKTHREDGDSVVDTITSTTSKDFALRQHDAITRALSGKPATFEKGSLRKYPEDVTSGISFAKVVDDEGKVVGSAVSTAKTKSIAVAFDGKVRDWTGEFNKSRFKDFEQKDVPAYYVGRTYSVVSSRYVEVSVFKTEHGFRYLNAALHYLVVGDGKYEAFVDYKSRVMSFYNGGFLGAVALVTDAKLDAVMASDFDAATTTDVDDIAKMSADDQARVFVNDPDILPRCKNLSVISREEMRDVIKSAQVELDGNATLKRPGLYTDVKPDALEAFKRKVVAGLVARKVFMANATNLASDLKPERVSFASLMSRAKDDGIIGVPNPTKARVLAKYRDTANRYSYVVEVRDEKSSAALFLSDVSGANNYSNIYDLYMGSRYSLDRLIQMSGSVLSRTVRALVAPVQATPGFFDKNIPSYAPYAQLPAVLITGKINTGPSRIEPLLWLSAGPVPKELSELGEISVVPVHDLAEPPELLNAECFAVIPVSEKVLRFYLASDTRDTRWWEADIEDCGKAALHGGNQLAPAMVMLSAVYDTLFSEADTSRVTGAVSIAGNEKKSFVVNTMFPEGETARVRVANSVVCNGSNVFVCLKKNGAAMEMYQIAIHAKDGLYFEQFFNVPCSVGDEEFFASVPWMRFKQKVVDVGGFMQYLRVLAKEQIGKTQPIGRALNKLFGDETLWDQAASATVTKRKYEAEVQARKREESDARFRERAEAEYETAKADFLSGKMIDAKYFEDLLSEFSITPHPRTLGWVRNNLTGLSTSSLRILRGAKVPDGFRDLRDQLVAAMVEWQETEAAINKP